MLQPHPFDFFDKLGWIDGRPLLPLIEPYRRAIFEAAYQHDDGLDTATPGTASRVDYNLILCGRAKKNWKSSDLVLWCIYKLTAWLSWNGNQVYTIANDEGQAADDLDLGKRLISANPELGELLRVKSNVIERRDGKGFWEILPAGDIVGSHGKTYLLCTFDEIHGYKNWDILEAMQLDPSRHDAQQWFTSYASLFHRPGIPLFDLFNAGKRGDDPRMYFSWYAADYCTDPDFENASPEDRANPSHKSWADPDYLEQQQRRLPAHKYRRLHLNLPGLPEGSAFTAEMVTNAIDRGVKVRPPEDGIDYSAFTDMCGGSNDDATQGIGHKAPDGRAVLDCVMNQGQRPPFDPRKAVERFAAKLKEYRVFTTTGDRFAGNTFQAAFESQGIAYRVSELTKSKLYEALEPKLNGGEVVLLDHPVLEQQLLGLVWRGGKIDHTSGEHDDFANVAAGVIYGALRGAGNRFIGVSTRSAVADGPDSPWEISPRRGTIPDW